GDHLAPLLVKLALRLRQRRLAPVLREQHQHVALPGNCRGRAHEHWIGVADHGNAEQREFRREGTRWDAVLADADDEDLARGVDGLGYLRNLRRRIDESR